MRVIIDKREQSLYEKCQELLCKQTNEILITLSREELAIGDIVFQSEDYQDILIIERKSYSDLIASIKDGRYEEQSYRLLNSSNLPPHSIFYLLEGMASQIQSPRDKKMVYSSMTSMQFFKGFSLQRTSSMIESAQWILNMADKLEREFEKGKTPYYFTSPFLNMFRKFENKQPLYLPNAPVKFNIFNIDKSLETKYNVPPISEQILENVHMQVGEPTNYCNFVKKVKKDNITPENIGEIILCQIPGISSKTAISIMKQYSNFPTFMDELKKNPDCINNIQCETNGKLRKISKTCAENIRNFLLHKVTASNNIAVTDEEDNNN